jgi:membrane protein
MNTVWAVPHKDRPSFVTQRVRGIGLLVFLGVLFIASTFITGAVSSTFGGIGSKIGGYVVSLLVNGALFFASFRLMTDSNVPNRDLRWGTLVGAVLWTVLQTIGTLYLHHVNTSNYGVFGVVIPLIIWLHLGGQVLMYSAEVNSVTSRKLWPRSFFGDPTEPADKRARRALAKVEERSDDQTVDVAFTPPVKDEPPPG